MRCLRSRLLIASWAISAILCPRNGTASPSAKLVYVRGSGADVCPGEAELRKAVATRLGYDPFFISAQKTVVAQVARAVGGFRARVQIVGDDGNARGEREISTKGDDCGEVVTAIALAVSIALDDLDEAAPNAAEPPNPAPSSAPPVDTSSPAPAPSLPPPPTSSPPTSTSVPADLRLSLGPTLSFGTAPSAALGGSGAARLNYGSFGARLDFRGDLGASGAAPVGRVETNTVVASLSGCVRATTPFACLGAGLGSLSSKTTGIARPATDSALLGVAVARLGADIPLGSVLYLEPFVEGALHLTPLRVQIDGVQAFGLPVGSLTAAVHIGGRIL